MTRVRTKQSCMLLICVLSFALNTHSQPLTDIKNNSQYVWGEGMGVTVEEAEKAALAQMSRSISVSIFSETGKTNNNGNVVWQSISQAVSSARLRNVEIKVLSEEPNARVFCYISKDEVKKMFKQREERVLDLVETGKKAEERLQIDDALRCYYWALVLSNSNPEPISISFANQNGQASSILPIKIKSVLQMLKAEVTEGEVKGGRIESRIRFTYNNNPVATLQYNYHDGQSIVGPVVVKNGIGEVDLASFPSNGKLHLTYETRFRNEVDPLDGDLSGIYSVGSLPTFDASADIPVKLKGDAVKAGKAEKDISTTAKIAAQPAINRKTITLKPVANTNSLLDAVLNVEAAISEKNPELAYKRFTPEGYKLFCKLLNETGNISLSGKSEYKFINADGYLIGRSTQIKIKFKGGKTFMENLVYRFNPNTKKIESIAFALTKRAEDDIMNASANWPEVSRWAILNFMEDYQTAFALKRLDYISNIFSDDAIIITGTVLKKATESDQVFDMNKLVKFDNSPTKVAYSKHTKSEYIQRLGKIFQNREYVHLTFENNVTNLINLPSVIPDGAAFGIEIKQRYSSSGYSDEGYLTLAFDTRGEHPIIHVRLWQPDKTDMMSLQEFISKFSN